MGPAIDETLYMTFVSGAITVVLGLALGIALVSTGHRGLTRNQAVYQVLSAIVNVGRSMPFLILMIAIIPLTRLLVFYARLAETALDGVEQGKIEAALMLGASRIQITFGVLVREALPSLIQAATVTLVTLLGYSAMAASIGAGGLGALALQYGYQRYQNDVMILTVIVIVLIVGVIQVVGDMLSRLADHR